MFHQVLWGFKLGIWNFLPSKIQDSEVFKNEFRSVDYSTSKLKLKSFFIHNYKLKFCSWYFRIFWKEIRDRLVIIFCYVTWEISKIFKYFIEPKICMFRKKKTKKNLPPLGGCKDLQSLPALDPPTRANSRSYWLNPLS